MFELNLKAFEQLAEVLAVRPADAIVRGRQLQQHRKAQLRDQLFQSDPVSRDHSRWGRDAQLLAERIQASLIVDLPHRLERGEDEPRERLKQVAVLRQQT